jgi:S-adenosylmethionine:tRNA ribosyltransferase-isomerase
LTAAAFELPASLEATAPPEARGITRDSVRLMVASRSSGRIAHVRFRDLPRFMRAGDVLVVNVSATLPSALAERRTDGRACRVHVSTRVPELGPSWRAIELRSADGARPARAGTGETVALEDGASFEVVAPYASDARLVLARFRGSHEVEDHLARFGEPIRYGHVRTRWPLRAYQNVYARVPGSAEMPSAGRPFSTRLITDLVAGGVSIAPIVLHAGVSSPERHESPFPEYYEVPASTARLLAAIRRGGGRIVAVGTTVVRALESVGAEPGAGWTGLKITAERELHVVDGLITGWHEPAASHLDLLEAVAGASLLERCYAEALRHGYLWHEFGDSHLLLP